MLPEELKFDLESQGFKVSKFSIDTDGKRIARLVLKALRGPLTREDRKIASQIVSFNLPGANIHFSPLGPGLSNDMQLSWLI